MQQRGRIQRNPNNTPFLSLPLTGPDAISERFPVAGSYEIGDGSGRRVLVAEGETCAARGRRVSYVTPANVVTRP